MADEVRLTEAEKESLVDVLFQPRHKIEWFLVDTVTEVVTARVQAARAEDAARLAEVERLVTEYESAITWDTTCLNCSSLMHKNIAEYVRAEKAEERLAAVQEIADRGITGWDLTPTVSGNEDVTWWYDYLRALDNIWRTRVTAALGVTAPTASEAGQHEFEEDVDDASMCTCGVPALTHDQVYPAPAEASEVEGSDRG